MKKFLAILAAVAVIFISPAAQASTFKSSTDCEILPITILDFYWARVVNCNEWISLREYPSVEARRLTKIPLGSLVKIYKGMLGEHDSTPSNGFYYTEYNGMKGWCLMEYIRVGEHAGAY